MKRTSQHELFAQRPVRSDFARRGGSSGRGINLRKVGLICSVLAFAVGAGVFINSLMDRTASESGEIPTVQAELPIKQRPEQPGGIDIPHQDVTVFQQLDNANAQASKKSNVEHLLPEPETPKDVTGVQSETAPPTPSIDTLVKSAPQDTAPPPQAQPVPKVEELPPAITAAEPVKAEPAKVEPTPVVAEKKEDEKKPAEKKVTEKSKPAEKEKTADDKVAAALAAAHKPDAAAKALPVATKAAEPAAARLPKELFTADAPVASKTEAAATHTAPSSSPSLPAMESAGRKTVQIQVASYPSQAEADKELKKFQNKYAGILGGSSLHVVRAEIAGKGTYYRLMGPAGSEMKAKAICADIVKLKGSCLVVK